MTEAQNWVITNAKDYNLGDETAFDFAERAFLAGLKARKPKWHKVADSDLPKGNELVLIKITGCFVLGWTNGTNWFNDSNNGTIIDRMNGYRLV